MRDGCKAQMTDREWQDSLLCFCVCLRLCAMRRYGITTKSAAVLLADGSSLDRLFVIATT